jgi:predicted small metal-binding protein
MTKELRCADVGFDCEAVVHGESEDEVMQQAAQHARDVHGMSDADLQQNEGAIRGAIHDVA